MTVVRNNVDIPHKDLNFFKDRTNNHVFESALSYEELLSALANLKLKSAPDLDKFNYEIIHCLPEFYKRILIDIYSDILNECKFPEQWKNYLMIFIPKGNGKVKSIALASCLLKLLEKIINMRLMWWIESRDILSNS